LAVMDEAGLLPPTGVLRHGELLQTCANIWPDITLVRGKTKRSEAEKSARRKEMFVRGDGHDPQMS